MNFVDVKMIQNQSVCWLKTQSFEREISNLKYSRALELKVSGKPNNLY